MTKKRKRVSKHKDIARIDQESKKTHGWYVRVSFQGKTHSKFFPDKKNGGKDLFFGQPAIKAGGRILNIRNKEKMPENPFNIQYQGKSAC